MIRSFISLICVLVLYSISAYGDITIPLSISSLSVKNMSNVAVFEGMTAHGEPGEPELPYYTHTLLLPPEADLESIRVTVHGLTEQLLPEVYEINPGPPLAVQQEIFYPDGKTIVDGKDVAIYGSDNFFPTFYTEFINVGKMHEYKIVSVRVNPYRYNPVTKKLIRISGGELVISFQSEKNYHASSFKIPYGITNMVKKVVENYHEIGSSYGNLESYNKSEKRVLVLITTETIQSGSTKLQAFIESKKKKNYEVLMVTESKWDSEKIRKWLKANYKEKKIEFALLIGNPDPSKGDVPMKTMSRTPTDWYYNELSGTSISSKDVFAEVHVGRIPVYQSGDIKKLDKILTKTIKYENTPKKEINWRFNVLMAMKPIDKKTQAYELGEQIKDNTLKTCNWKWYRIYAKDYKLNPPPEKTPVTKTNVLNGWKSEKPGCVFWDTHGSPTSSSGMMSVKDCPKLDDNYPVYTFQGACLNAKPTVKNNLCYSNLVNGAIAANGGTISVTYSPGEKDYTKSGSIGGQNYWYALYLIKDSLTTSEANDAARAKIKGKKWKNHMALVLYGDPTMSPYVHAINSTKTKMNIVKKAIADKLVIVPNPGFSNSSITFSIISENYHEGQLIIYDALGTVVKKYTLPEGVKAVTWDLRNKQGRSVKSNTYLAIAQLTYNDGTVKKMTSYVGVK